MARWTRRRTKALAVKTGFSIYYVLFIIFIFAADDRDVRPVLPGPARGTSFPMRGFSTYWWEKLLEPSSIGDLQGALARSIILALVVMVITALFSTMLAMAFRRKFRGSNLLFLHDHARPDGAGRAAQPGSRHPAAPDRHSAGPGGRRAWASMSSGPCRSAFL